MRQGIAVALLAVAVFSVSGAARAQPAPVAAATFTAAGLTLQPHVEWDRATLVVAGQEGHRVERGFKAPEAIVYDGLDAAGSPSPDGFYRYEAFLFMGSERLGVLRGILAVRNGQVARGGLKEEVMSPRPEPGDATVQGGPITPENLTDPLDILAGSGLGAGDITNDPSRAELELDCCGGVSSLERFPGGVALEAVDGAFTTGVGLVWVGDDSRVGLGTSTPQTALEVMGGAIIHGGVGIGTAETTAPLTVAGAGGEVLIVAGGTLSVARFDGAATNILFRSGLLDWRFQNNPVDGVFSIRDATNLVSSVRIYPGGQGSTLVLRNGRIGVRNTSPQHPIHAFNGARLTSGGVWANASSRESKQDIERLSTEEALATLEALDPVKFAYKVDATDRHVGFIAEDVPDLVASPDRKALAAMDVVAVLTRVVQEQQAQIAELRELVLARKAGAAGGR